MLGGRPLPEGVRDHGPSELLRRVCGCASDCKGANQACINNLCSSLEYPTLRINELDYDNVDTDAYEFVELYNHGSAVLYPHSWPTSTSTSSNRSSLVATLSPGRSRSRLSWGAPTSPSAATP